MAIRNIREMGEDVLGKVCKEVKEMTPRTRELIEDMLDTMYEANGVGLAAPQVGILKRICVVSRDGEVFYELINPVITKQAGKQKNIEGCLSVPGKHGYVERPTSITVEAFDRNGVKQIYDLNGFMSVIFCHEIDHLDGTLYVDKVVGGLMED